MPLVVTVTEFMPLDCVMGPAEFQLVAGSDAVPSSTSVPGVMGQEIVT